MIMENSLNTINELLDPGKNGFVGFGYKQIRSSAELAAQKYGCEWAKKYPPTQEMIELKEKIRRIVLSQTPRTHSNKDVVWQRFRQYALKYCGK
jgi:hypothetical protein